MDVLYTSAYPFKDFSRDDFFNSSVVSPKLGGILILYITAVLRGFIRCSALIGRSVML